VIEGLFRHFGGGRSTSEKESILAEVNRDLLAPCGLYCGVCAVYIATRDDNEKFKKRLTTVYDVPVEQIQCKGCLSDDVFVYCTICQIKSCVKSKGYDACHQCEDFPCEYVESFPYPVGKKVILRATPQWREWGTEKWVAEEENRYHCPECSYVLFRGAKRCRNCDSPVDVD
jgi:hypothetical protein